MYTAALVQGHDGSFYGTSPGGGDYGAGMIFKIDPRGVFTTIYSFDESGFYPCAGLTLGAAGSFYGTTFSGGPDDAGTIFKLDAAGTVMIVHSFEGSDGARPCASLTLVEEGILYGTTSSGGAHNLGTIFKLDATGVLTTLHSFDGGDGSGPYGSVTPGPDSFYGTTFGVGAHNGGTIFRLDAAGVLTTLLSFNRNIEGERPRAGLAPGASGSLYGTTWRGGRPNYAGTIFKLDPDGVFTTVHSFRGIDGASPWAGLTPGDDGSFYGTTELGGAHRAGTIFKLDADGFLTTLHSFQGTDGERPIASLTRGEDGHFYGTTAGGGLGYGVIFRLNVGAGGMRLPGDCNGDGSRDISDALCLLGFLFLGEPEGLPCGSGLPGDGANLRLLDHNGDRTIDVSDPVSLLGFLFSAGTPPHAGLDCMAIPGCSTACPE